MREGGFMELGLDGHAKELDGPLSLSCECHAAADHCCHVHSSTCALSIRHDSGEDNGLFGGMGQFHSSGGVGGSWSKRADVSDVFRTGLSELLFELQGQKSQVQEALTRREAAAQDVDAQ